MNAVEIEEAVSDLVAEPFDADEFPYQFITAYGAKKATVDRLRKGDTNQSDVGGVLQRNNIHIAGKRGLKTANGDNWWIAEIAAMPQVRSADERTPCTLR